MAEQNFSQNEAPDQDSIPGKTEAARVNTQRERDQVQAGARGSNHIGQGSGGDSTHRTVEAADTQTNKPSEPTRMGNSEQDPEEQDLDEDMDMELSADDDEDDMDEDQIEDEMNDIGGTERADVGYPPKQSPTV